MAKNDRVIKTRDDAVAVAKVYAKSFLKSDQVNRFKFEYLGKNTTKEIWEVAAFEEGSPGRMLIDIEAKCGGLLDVFFEP
jgi:hypothetical protein